MSPHTTGAALLTAAALAGAANTVPTMTLFSSGGSKVFNLPAVKSLSFGDGTSAIRRVRNEFCGVRMTGLSGGLARFALSGTAGTQANLQLIDLRGRILWAGSTQLDPSGKAELSAPAVTGGLVLARYRNESFLSTAPVPLVGGAR